MKKYRVKVMKVLRPTPTAATVRMERPEGFAYKPGQWGYFTLGKGEGAISRTLSFSSSPTEPHLEFTKRLTGSDFSRAIGQLREGEDLSFEGPMGNLVYEGGLDKVTFIAGGIGITPVRSILKNMTDKDITGDKILLYGNLNREETAFREEIARWQEADPRLKVVYVFEKPDEGWDGYTGFINGKIVAQSCPDLPGQTFYVSGPPPMVRAVLGALEQLQVSPERIVKEELAGYESMV